MYKQSTHDWCTAKNCMHNIFIISVIGKHYSRISYQNRNVMYKSCSRNAQPASWKLAILDHTLLAQRQCLALHTCSFCGTTEQQTVHLQKPSFNQNTFLYPWRTLQNLVQKTCTRKLRKVSYSKIWHTFMQVLVQQDSIAIAKKTARCAQYMGALKSFETPQYAPGYCSRNF